LSFTWMMSPTCISMPCAYRWVALSDTDRVTGLSRNLLSMQFLILSMPAFRCQGRHFGA
jgi:hypothetical protein